MRTFPLALTLVAAVTLSAAPTTSAQAPSGRTTVDATYEISIAGWGIARATLDLSLERGRYAAELEMRPKGVAKIVTAVRTSGPCRCTRSQRHSAASWRVSRSYTRGSCQDSCRTSTATRTSLGNARNVSSSASTSTCSVGGSCSSTGPSASPRP